MKMYILVKESIPVGNAIVSASHASLAAYLKFNDDEQMKQWVSGPFYKVVCKVNEKEFENAKQVEKNVIITESSLNGQEVAIAFCPREEWPKMFKFFKKYA
jgi:peptidyl-tRNA hydrolase